MTVWFCFLRHLLLLVRSRRYQVLYPLVLSSSLQSLQYHVAALVISIDSGITSLETTHRS